MSDGNLRFRRARRQDVPAIVRLLASDPLGATRETSGTGELPEAYWQAFEAIDADPPSSWSSPSWTAAWSGLRVDWLSAHPHGDEAAALPGAA